MAAVGGVWRGHRLRNFGPLLLEPSGGRDGGGARREKKGAGDDKEKEERKWDRPVEDAFGCGDRWRERRRGIGRWLPDDRRRLR